MLYVMKFATFFILNGGNVFTHKQGYSLMDLCPVLKLPEGLFRHAPVISEQGQMRTPEQSPLSAQQQSKSVSPVTADTIEFKSRTHYLPIPKP
ncbi:hypothetical protein AVEN_247990-1 [Araneus ventricosus]|uniref:Uncharacterized protein n=1 Tax=Araneus ventricosus TaxID=182803 RepID=A0A4Y2MWV5_ARAVE|nr:hypothetical protein AVEN_247990-1 [Araneus ventricosus]